MPSLNLIQPNLLLLKQGATDNLYQSTFLPIFQRAETRIKEIIVAAIMAGTPLYSLRLQIMTVIALTDKKVPKNIRDRQVYLDGLTNKSEIYINKYYLPMVSKFYQAREMVRIATEMAPRPILVNTPEELLKISKQSADTRDLWAYQKGSPNVSWYDRELKKAIQQLAADPITTNEPGKKPISIWQRAELETRYNKQMQMLDGLQMDGVQYAWISSHPNCSKRCQQWQGKLVSLDQAARQPGFVVGKLDGHTVYSLPDIMAQVDKYGYQNNIICGFNCRHRLIPYKPGTRPPEKYSAKEVAKERAIEMRMRDMEREIRKLKTNEILSLKIRDSKSAKIFKARWQSLFQSYKALCEKNGYAWYQYRVNVL